HAVSVGEEAFETAADAAAGDCAAQGSQRELVIEVILEAGLLLPSGVEAVLMDPAAEGALSLHVLGEGRRLQAGVFDLHPLGTDARSTRHPLRGAGLSACS